MPHLYAVTLGRIDTKTQQSRISGVQGLLRDNYGTSKAESGQR